MSSTGTREPGKLSRAFAVSGRIEAQDGSTRRALSSVTTLKKFLFRLTDQFRICDREALTGIRAQGVSHYIGIVLTATIQQRPLVSELFHAKPIVDAQKRQLRGDGA
jgi:hypothetical protein